MIDYLHADVILNNRADVPEKPRDRSHGSRRWLGKFEVDTPVTNAKGCRCSAVPFGTNTPRRLGGLKEELLVCQIGARPLDGELLDAVHELEEHV